MEGQRQVGRRQGSRRGQGREDHDGAAHGGALVSFRYGDADGAQHRGEPGAFVGEDLVEVGLVRIALNSEEAGAGHGLRDEVAAERDEHIRGRLDAHEVSGYSSIRSTRRNLLRDPTTMVEAECATLFRPMVASWQQSP
jgi:hypothetical protein